jgi:uncharacterized membrane protein
MLPILLLHIIPGLIGIASGTVALLAFKGGNLHRKSGIVFVYAMLGMSASGAVMGALNGQMINVIAGSLTFYLVLTALTTVQRPSAAARWVDLGALLMALAVGVLGIAVGIGVVNAAGPDDGVPGGIGFFFGGVALLSALGDARRLADRRLQASPRLLRHLWRMCLALFIAVGSFFMGQAQVFPEAVRASGLLGVPVLSVVVLTVFWVVRVRFTKWRPKPAARARIAAEIA